ncbi:MAG: hypothetical protein ACRECO_02875 [Xanthobacteraceae bacterium]
MAKHKRQPAKRKSAPRRPKPAADLDLPLVEDDGGLSLHDLFQQQTVRMLDRADLSEEQKQSILVAMNCPCCGAGGLSFAVKLKRRKS